MNISPQGSSEVNTGGFWYIFQGHYPDHSVALEVAEAFWKEGTWLLIAIDISGWLHWVFGPPWGEGWSGQDNLQLQPGSSAFKGQPATCFLLLI